MNEKTLQALKALGIDSGSSTWGSNLASSNYEDFISGKGRSVNMAMIWNDHIDREGKTHKEEGAELAKIVSDDIVRAQQRLMDSPDLVKSMALAWSDWEKASESRAERKRGAKIESNQTITENEELHISKNEKEIDKIDKVGSMTYSIPDLTEYLENNDKALKIIQELKTDYNKSKEVQTYAKESFVTRRDVNEGISNDNLKNIEENDDIGSQAFQVEMASATMQGSPYDINLAKDIKSGNHFQQQFETYLSPGSKGYTQVVYDIKDHPDGINLERAIQEGRTTVIPAILESLRDKFYTAANRHNGFRLNAYQRNNITMPAFNNLVKANLAESSKVALTNSKLTYNAKQGEVINQIIEGTYEINGIEVSLLGTKELGYTNSYLYQLSKQFPSAPGEHPLSGALLAWTGKASTALVAGTIDVEKFRTFLDSYVEAKDGSGKIRIRDIPWIKKTGYVIALDKKIAEVISERNANNLALKRNDIINASDAVRDKMLSLNPKERTETRLNGIIKSIVDEYRDKNIIIDISSPNFTAKDFPTIEDDNDDFIVNHRIPQLVREGGKSNWTQIQQELEKINDIDTYNTQSTKYKNWFDSDTGDVGKVWEGRILPEIQNNPLFQDLDPAVQQVRLNQLKEQFYSNVYSWTTNANSKFSNEHLVTATGDFLTEIKNNESNAFENMVKGAPIYKGHAEQQKDLKKAIQAFKPSFLNKGKTQKAINSEEFIGGEKIAIQAIVSSGNYDSSYFKKVFNGANLANQKELEQDVIGADGNPTGQKRKMNYVDFMIGRILNIDDEAIKELTGMSKERLLAGIITAHKVNFSRTSKLNEMFNRFPETKNNTANSGVIASLDANTYSTVLRVGNNNAETITLINKDNIEDITTQFPFYKPSKKASDYTISEIIKLTESGLFSNIGRYNISADTFRRIIPELLGPDNPATKDIREDLIFEKGSTLKFTKEVQLELLLRAGLERSNNSAGSTGALSMWLKTRKINEEDQAKILKLFKTGGWSKYKANNPNALVSGVADLFYISDF